MTLPLLDQHSAAVAAQVEDRILAAIETRIQAKPAWVWKVEIGRTVIIAAIAVLTAYFAMDKKVALLDAQVNGRYGIAAQLDQIQMDIRKLLERVR